MKKLKKPKTVREAILKYGHDEDFAPQKKAKPTNYPIGSDDRVEELRRRIEDGEELWHEEDNKEYAYGVRTRNEY